MRGLSTSTVQILAEMVGTGAKSPAELAVRYGVKPNTIVQRRRRAERRLSNDQRSPIIFPRMHSIGRPIKQSNPQSSFPSDLRHAESGVGSFFPSN